MNIRNIKKLMNKAKRIIGKGYTRCAINIQWYHTNEEVLTEAMISEIRAEHMRGYNYYAPRINEHIDRLNSEFDKSHPYYFELNKGKPYTALTEYNYFMASAFKRLVVNGMNNDGFSTLLLFDVDPTTAEFISVLKSNISVITRFEISKCEPIEEVKV